MAIIVFVPAGGLIAAESPRADQASAAAGADRTDQPLYTLHDDAYQEALHGDPNDVALRFGWWGVSVSGSPTKIGQWQGLNSSSPFWSADGLITTGDRTVDFIITGPEDESTQALVHYYGGPGLEADLNYERFPHTLDHKLPLGFTPIDPATGMVDPTFGRFPATAYPTVPTSVTTPPNAAAAPANPLNTSSVARYAQDLNAGQDYAMRVDEVSANFKGIINENIRWRLNYFGQEEQGYRQASEMSHCYDVHGSDVLAEGVDQMPLQPNGPRCHWLSQTQFIDWQTNQIEPAIEVRLSDNLTVEYSRTMRSFNEADQMVFRTHNINTFPGVGANVLSPYDVVPNEYTDTDRLKVFAKLDDYTDVYALGYVGNNTDEFRNANRHFTGGDARITNRAIDGLQVTGYAKTYSISTSGPTEPLNTQEGSAIWGEPTLADVGPFIDTQFSNVGATARWRPFWDERGTVRSHLLLNGGYEYGMITRENLVNPLTVMSPFATTPLTSADMLSTTFVQPPSDTNKWFVGAIQDWSRAFRTELKYTFIDTRYPLFGVTPDAVVQEPGTVLGSAEINTMLPTHTDRVELCATWQPQDNFMLTATFYVEQATNHSAFAHFDETNYPVTISAWYAPTQKLSFNAGYAEFTDWIDQDITFGSQGRFGQLGSPNVNQWEESPGYTAPWFYGGKSQVVNFGAVYTCTKRLSFNGGVEYVHGIDGIDFIPGPPTTGPLATTLPGGRGAVLEQLPGGGTAPIDYNATNRGYVNATQASQTNVNTYLVSAGFDYMFRRGISGFFRYNFYDYEDLSEAFNSGRAHMFLTGLTATF